MEYLNAEGITSEAQDDTFLLFAQSAFRDSEIQWSEAPRVRARRVKVLRASRVKVRDVAIRPSPQLPLQTGDGLLTVLLDFTIRSVFTASYARRSFA